VAHLVPAVSEGYLCSMGRGDAGGCEATEPEDTGSAAASSQNAECEDLELTMYLSSWYSPLGEGAVLPQQLPCQTAQ